MICPFFPQLIYLIKYKLVELFIYGKVKDSIRPKNKKTFLNMHDNKIGEIESLSSMNGDPLSSIKFNH